MTGKGKHRGQPGDVLGKALAQIDRSVSALEACKDDLTPEGYKALRIRLGHLMDTLYRIGEELSKST